MQVDRAFSKASYTNGANTPMILRGNNIHLFIHPHVDKSLGKSRASSEPARHNCYLPLLHLIQTRLPIELREKVYESLFDHDVPRAVPKSEDANNTHRWNNTLDATDVFHNEYIFYEKVMGLVISQEVQDICFRTTPIYFRGCKSFPDVNDLLSIQLPSGKHCRDLVRHLRVYLRFEHFQNEKAVELLSQPTILPPNSLFTEAQLELEMYKAYSARLDALAQLPSQTHKIKLEICVLYGRIWGRLGGDEERVRCNLFETVKSVYYHAKRAEADVSVHWEDFESGERMPATRLYDEDIDSWMEVSSTFIILDVSLTDNS